MSNTKIINFHNPDEKVYKVLVHCALSCFQYPQVYDTLSKLSVYIPEDQYKLFCKLIDIQLELDIGCRQDERSAEHIKI